MVLGVSEAWRNAVLTSNVKILCLLSSYRRLCEILVICVQNICVLRYLFASVVGQKSNISNRHYYWHNQGGTGGIFRFFLLYPHLLSRRMSFQIGFEAQKQQVLLFWIVVEYSPEEKCHMPPLLVLCFLKGFLNTVEVDIINYLVDFVHVSWPQVVWFQLEGYLRHTTSLFQEIIYVFHQLYSFKILVMFLLETSRKISSSGLITPWL